jgi:hypothetical protein
MAISTQPQVQRVVLYGSRALGRQRSGSDIERHGRETAEAGSADQSSDILQSHQPLQPNRKTGGRYRPERTWGTSGFHRFDLRPIRRSPPAGKSRLGPGARCSRRGRADAGAGQDCTELGVDLVAPLDLLLHRGSPHVQVDAWMPTCCSMAAANPNPELKTEHLCQQGIRGSTNRVDGQGWSSRGTTSSPDTLAVGAQSTDQFHFMGIRAYARQAKNWHQLTSFSPEPWPRSGARAAPAHPTDAGSSASVDPVVRSGAGARQFLC